jgi:hypothetical protein
MILDHDAEDETVMNISCYEEDDYGYAVGGYGTVAAQPGQFKHLFGIILSC